MNAVFVSGLMLIAATSLPGTPTLAADGCRPHVIQSDTKFPLRSQLRGQAGAVFVSVMVDENGRAQSADLHRSSGYRLLDRAATRSVRENWVFDVSSCERKDLPANHVVVVEYHNDEY